MAVSIGRKDVLRYQVEAYISQYLTAEDKVLRYQVEAYISQYLTAEDKKNLAATYSPADKPQYHRRKGVLLPCSGWERVSPPCYGHQEIMQIHHAVIHPMIRSNRNDNMAKPLGALVPVG